uniref:Uncharacterized protein n=1 Tax=Arundo donax TaxID=35708 RepID=A0A0A9B866_ARUDO
MCSLSCPGSLTSMSIPVKSDGRSKHGVSLKVHSSVPASCLAKITGKKECVAKIRMEGETV